VIFDIGCNIGYTALLALIQNPQKRMILVDPNPEALKQAALNNIENNLGSNLSYMTAFVSETVDETIKFYTVGSGAAGSMYASHAVTAASNNMFLNVKTVTLDYLYDYYQLQPDLIKIDVEGAETLVMKGAKKIAKATQCTFFIEMHNVEGLGMEKATQLMIDWAEEMGYSVWYLKSKTILTSPEVVKNRGKCHLLLLPKEKDFPEYLKNVEQNAPLPKTVL
jgi:FkbM family methyltransferase